MLRADAVSTRQALKRHPEAMVELLVRLQHKVHAGPHVPFGVELPAEGPTCAWPRAILFETEDQLDTGRKKQRSGPDDIQRGV